MVAKRLDKKLRENLFDARNNLFQTDTQSRNFNFQRPLLIVLDRNVDMATPLHHTWTYQALAHDLLDMALNRVVVEENIPTGGNSLFFKVFSYLFISMQQIINFHTKGVQSMHDHGRISVKFCSNPSLLEHDDLQKSSAVEVLSMIYYQSDTI